ncbi:hypothetical protein [Streptomyces griseoluteus]
MNPIGPLSAFRSRRTRSSDSRRLLAESGAAPRRSALRRIFVSAARG